MAGASNCHKPAEYRGVGNGCFERARGRLRLITMIKEEEGADESQIAATARLLFDEHRANSRFGHLPRPRA